MEIPKIEILKGAFNNYIHSQFVFKQSMRLQEQYKSRLAKGEEKLIFTDVHLSLILIVLSS